MIVRSQSRRLLILAAAITAVGAAVVKADDATYLGGQWNVGDDWDTGSVPTDQDTATLPGNLTGTVQLNGGAVAGQLNFGGGSSGYQLIGEPTAELSVGRIYNNGDGTNAISTSKLTGLQIDGEHSQLEIDGANVNIDSQILEEDGLAMNLYVEGTFKNNVVNSGVTELQGNTTLIDSGQFVNTVSVTADKARLYLENNGTQAIGSRLPDGATLTLHASELTDQGSNGSGLIDRETVGSIALGAGGTLVIMRDGASIYAPGPSTAPRLTRDTTDRGTMILDQVQSTKFIATPEGMADDIVPYIIMRRQPGVFLPTIYDNGPDGVPGDSDDGGLQPVANFSFPGGFGSTSHVFASSDYALTADASVRTWTSYGGARLNLGTSRLTLNDGVLVLTQDGTGSKSAVYGQGTSMISAASGRELFIYTDTPATEISARIGGNNGVTFTSFDQSLWSYAQYVLSGSNVYSGPTTINGGNLVITSAASLPSSSTVKLVESMFDFEFTPTASIPNRIIFDTGNQSAHGGFDYIRPLTFKAGATFSLTGGMEGRGDFFLAGEGSTVKIDTPSSVVATTPGEFNLWTTGTITLQVDGQLGDGITTFGGAVINGGSLVGKGRLTGSLQLGGGTLAPGSSGATGTAVMRVRDASIYGGDSRFNINGTARGTQYDGLDIDGYLDTSDDMQVTIESGSFVGQIGQKFDLIRYANHFGSSLPTVNVPLATQAGGQWVHYFDNDSFTLAVAGPSGDANLDGKVGFDDLVLLAQYYNQVGTNWLTADFNNDGVTNFSDLVVLAQHYGQNAIAGSFTVASGSQFASDWELAQSLVPEPTTMGITLAAAAAVRRRRR